MKFLVNLIVVLSCFSLIGCAVKTPSKSEFTTTEKNLGIATGEVHVSPISVSDEGDIGFKVAKQFKGVEATEVKECWDVEYKSFIKYHSENNTGILDFWASLIGDICLTLPVAIVQQVTFVTVPKPGCKFISSNERDVTIAMDAVGAKAIVSIPPGERYHLNDDGSGSFTFKVEDIFRVLSAGKGEEVKLTVDIEHDNERYSTEKFFQKKLFSPYLISLLESDKDRGKAIKYLSSTSALSAKNFTAVLGDNGKVPEELTETLKMFIAGEDVNAKDKFGNTPLIRSSEENNLKAVKLLLEHGANVDEQNAFDETALMVASEKAHLGIVKLLLSHKANSRLQNNNGETALSLAISNNNPLVMRAILEHGKTNQEAEVGLTELMDAVKRGEVDIVKLLLDNGVDVSSADAKAMIDFAKRVKDDREAQQQLEIAHRNALAQQQTMAQQRAQQKRDSTANFFLTILNGAVQGYNEGQRKSRTYTQPSLTTSPPTKAYSGGCRYDTDCAVGKKCIKKAYSQTGTCMELVNKYGNSALSLPTDKPKECFTSVDCPIGFTCDSDHRVCVR